MEAPELAMTPGEYEALIASRFASQGYEVEGVGMSVESADVQEPLPAGLLRLIDRATAADGSTRIEYRDRIAAFGEAAIDPMIVLLRDPRLGAFAVRVLDKVAMVGGHRSPVLAALRASAASLPSKSVANDVLVLTRRLELQIAANRHARQGQADIAAAHAAAQRRRAIEVELEGTRQDRVVYAWTWLRGLVELLPGVDALKKVEAERLVTYIDRLDAIRRSTGSEPLEGTRRSQAAMTWLRNRLQADGTARSSHCWRCESKVYSDLNPNCPACRWMVCVCDACRHPEHEKGPCPRMSAKNSSANPQFGLREA